jgi:hypothetical protein
VSLGVIALVLTVAILLSIRKDRREQEAAALAGGAGADAGSEERVP